MNLKSMLPIAAGAGVLLLALSAFRRGTTQSAEPQSSPNDLPGYTFPAPDNTGVVTNAIGEVVATNYVSGSAIAAYVNAQEIRAKAAAGVTPWVRSYQDVKQYDTDQYMLPIGINNKLEPVDLIAGDLSLNITPQGWGVMRRLSKPNRLGSLYAPVAGQSDSFGGLASWLPTFLP